MFFKFINIAHQIYFEFILLNDVNNVVFIDNSKSAGKTNGLNPEKSQQPETEAQECHTN